MGKVKFKYRGFLRSSRTYDYGALLAIFGAIQIAFPALEPYLKDFYGIAFVLAGALVGWLRYKTTGPVGEK